MNEGTDFQEKFLIGFIILSNLVSSDDSDGVVGSNGMSFFRKETLFGVFIVLKSNITMIDVRFLFWVVPGSFSGEEFNFNNFTESAEVL